MPSKKKSTGPRRHHPTHREQMAFPILLVLVMTVIVLGMFFYTGLLVAGSAIFAGFFGWLWWTRRHPRAVPPVAKKNKSRPRRQRPSR